jgi:sugar/nucleoside kinase (ribokinase family)
MILVFGTICLDRVRFIPNFPKPGGYVEVTDDRTLLGGEAANTANALKTWGVDVRLEGNRLGTGPNGELIRGLLAERGILPTVDAHDTGDAPVCDLLITPDGERTMIGLGFSASDGSIDISRIKYPAGEWFTAEPNMSKTAREAFQRAHAAGMRLYLMDFSRADEQIPEGSICQHGTDWVGERNHPQANLRWASEWSKRHDCTTILTDGPNGFAVSDPQGNAYWHDALVEPGLVAVDSTGAGDLFRAGTLYGLDQGWPLERSLLYGAAAGALICRAIGATVNVPTIAEIESLIAEKRA